MLLQIILIALNAFFAATEMAMVSLNEKKVRAKANEGDKKAMKMLKMIEEPTGFLSTIQVGITLAGFLGSAFAADNFSGSLTDFVVSAFGVPESYVPAIDSVSVIVITLILSYFTLVFGELVPKRVAMKNKEKFAEMVCGVIAGLSAVLKPVISFLTISTNGVLRLLGIDPNEKDEAVSEEDIVIMLDAGADEGTLDESDIEYIKNVFKLDKSTAADVMTQRKNIAFISENATESEILELIHNERYSRIPVCGDKVDEIVGILYTKDYLLNYRKPDFELKQVIAEPMFVPEMMKLDQLFKEMQTSHNHIVVVVSEYGITSGIVTMEDILEEIVGEIWDESDEEITNICEMDANTYRVLCLTTIEDFFEFFEVTPDEESEATTVNGWLSEKCGNIPAVGDTLEYENLVIEVIKADDMMAEEIKVKVMEKVCS